MRVKEKQLKTLLTVVAVSAFALQSGAAVINWGVGAIDISAEADIVNQGTLVAAENQDSGSVTPLTINGVTFGYHGESGNITYSSGRQYGPLGHNGDDSALGTDYGTLLNGVSWDEDNGGTYTVTFDNLTSGQDYMVQIWAANPNQDTQTVSWNDGNGNSVGLLADTTSGGGGVGQYAVGTFTAGATSESIFGTTNTGNPFFNAVQVRAIPEAASVGMLGLGAGLLLAARRYLW
jgi:hypothetical protein